MAHRDELAELRARLAECLEQARLVEVAQCVADDPATALGERVVVLTVAGFSFRLMPYIAAPPSRQARCVLDQDDYLYEPGNVFCGAIKRRLGQAFPSLGISTRSMLTAGHLSYLTDVRDKVLNLGVRARIDAGGAAGGRLPTSALSVARDDRGGGKPRRP